MCHAVVSILIASFAAGTALAALDTAALGEQYFGNDAAWYRDKIPFFEISDSDIQDVYYYRWKIFRAHQRDLGERGYVSTGQYTHTHTHTHVPHEIGVVSLISHDIYGLLQSSWTMWAGNWSHGRH